MIRKTCLDQLPFCKGECCKQIRIEGILRQPARDTIVTYQIGMITDDMKSYYELRRIIVIDQEKGIIRFRNRKAVRDGNGFIFILPCKKLLGDGKCSGWYDDRPEFCKELDWHSKERGDFYITPKCIYK